MHQLRGLHKLWDRLKESMISGVQPNSEIMLFLFVTYYLKQQALPHISSLCTDSGRFFPFRGCTGY